MAERGLLPIPIVGGAPGSGPQLIAVLGLDRGPVLGVGITGIVGLRLLLWGVVPPGCSGSGVSGSVTSGVVGSGSSGSGSVASGMVASGW
ncbi:hypothetical protein GBA65_13965 [Rubrobacter marinus]|uniref:Uncharacterized protein n=1 Tax=Rubrobacter marinus TaxID=2653852 RepID=A0A6G8PYV6_9ACTN|nr:hypothetical protein [Rubrobacter marinus]QIN79434.1 hypothetical protein GBA65_13965 [Rubrobacter marinus]